MHKTSAASRRQRPPWLPSRATVPHDSRSTRVAMELRTAAPSHVKGSVGGRGAREEGHHQPRPAHPDATQPSSSWQDLRQSIDEKIRSRPPPKASLSTMRASRGLQRLPSSSDALTPPSDAFTNPAWAEAFSNMTSHDARGEDLFAVRPAQTRDESFAARPAQERDARASKDRSLLITYY